MLLQVREGSTYTHISSTFIDFCLYGIGISETVTLPTSPGFKFGHYILSFACFLNFRQTEFKKQGVCLRHNELRLCIFSIKRYLAKTP